MISITVRPSRARPAQCAPQKAQMRAASPTVDWAPRATLRLTPVGLSTRECESSRGLASVPDLDYNQQPSSWQASCSRRFRQAAHNCASHPNNLGLFAVIRGNLGLSG